MTDTAITPIPPASNPISREKAELGRIARLSRLAVSGGTSASLLERYVTDAVEATGATRGFAALAEAEVGGLVLVATAGDGWTDSARLTRLADRDGSSTITSWVATTGKPVRIGDLAQAAPDYQPFFTDIRSVLAVPIAMGPEERVRGVINLECVREEAFTDGDESFVQALADLSAMRLALEDLGAREAALVQMGKELSSAPDPDSLMQRVVAITKEILRFEDCSIFFLDPNSRRLVLVATRGQALSPQVKKAAYELGVGLTGWVGLHGEPIRVRDPRTDPRHKGLHRELADEETGAFLAVPIKSLTGVVGVLRVLRRKSTSPWFPNDFTLADQEVLATIASQVGAAVDNAQLTDRLLQSERLAAWGEMSAMSSHMIGNRVFAIKGDLNELEYQVGQGTEDAPLTATRRQVVPLLDGMKRGIFRLEELLAEFRDFVRATALATAPADATELTKSVVEEVFPKRGNIVLETDYTDEPLPINADPIKLKRAFSEIVENAVTFQETADKGVVRIKTRRLPPNSPLPTRIALPKPITSGWAEVTFADEGPGVPDGDKEKIFRPFFTSRNRGMGLGLAIVKGIIEAHHGGIVEVGTQGQGARFVILLPLREES
ncbi:MAG: GAF domain-containing sensor histidine kinase [Armatimonadota bacterium]